jgi:ribosomal protein S6--L-glutamate ligase
MAEHKTIIGWQEWVSLPNLNIPIIKAKVDTGARTSSLHADRIEHFQKSGMPFVYFEVYPIQKNGAITLKCEAPLIDRRQVKSSCGEEEHRPVIITTITLNDIRWEIELNLTNRDHMGYRMLLGRNAMKNHLIIDPSERFLQRKILKKEIINFYPQPF